MSNLDRTALEQTAKDEAWEYYREIRSVDPGSIDCMVSGFERGYVLGFLAATAQKALTP